MREQILTLIIQFEIAGLQGARRWIVANDPGRGLLVQIPDRSEMLNRTLITERDMASMGRSLFNTTGVGALDHDWLSLGFLSTN